MEDHHSGGGVHPDGSTNCLGNHELHAMHAVECEM